jgi:hypothetical protein
MSQTVQGEIPDQLFQQAQTLVHQGWAGSFQEIVNDALRRYLESHQEALTEAFIKDDVQWGLQGDD